MYHLDNTSGVPEMPEPKETQTISTRWFGESVDQGGISWPGADWFNIVQAELLAILDLVEESPDKTRFNQIANAIKILADQFPSQLGLPDGTDLINYLALNGASERTVLSRLRDNIYITDFYSENDGDDWHPAYQRASLLAKNVWFPDNRVYTVRSTLIMPAGGGICGSGNAVIASPPATDASGSGLITVIRADNVNDVRLTGIIIDGGVREVMTEKNYTRPLRMINCKNIVWNNLTIINNADWSFSLESCAEISIQRYKQRSYVYQDPALTRLRAGGRDGGHLMDCINAVLIDSDIESGDDCIGITSKLSGTSNITVRGLRGSSVIASLVIYNEEQITGSNDYYAMPADKLVFEDIRVKKAGSSRNVVRIAKYNTLSTIKDCSVSGVSGEGYSHGALFQWVEGLNLADIDVSSSGAHGAYISNCTKVEGAVKGSTKASGFDGVNIFNGEAHNLDVESSNSASYGIQVNGLKNSVVRPKASNCGGVDFSLARGGGGRIVNTVGVHIPSGLFIGETSTSYYGLNAVPGSNTDLRVADDVKRSGLIPSTPLGKINYLRQPAASLKFKEDGAQNIILYSSVGCTLTRNGVGNYTVTFTTPMDSTGFQFFLGAWHVGAERKVILSTQITVNGFSFVVRDTAGANTYSDHISLIAYNT